MAQRQSILVVDDEESICLAFGRFFERRGWGVQVAPTGARAAALCRQSPPDVIFLDVRLPDANGLDLIESLRRDSGGAPVIVMTAYGTLDVVTRAMGHKVFDYLIKPLDLDRALELACRAAKPRSDLTPARPEAPAGGIVGGSPAMQRVYRQMALAAHSDVSVLILGPTGTGKELVARAIHDFSPRRDKPFVAVNCGALPETLVEGELFGHVRGAFTGADGDRAGRFEAAQGGTILLDEVGDLPPPAQVKLLRVLDSRTVERLGSPQSIRLDVRILAATNRDLAQEAQAGRFRADLFYRLAVMQIELPALCERREDIAPLAAHFLAGAQTSRPSAGISDEALECLGRYHWPGNVRELRNAIEHAALVAGGGLIGPEHLPPGVREGACTPAPTGLEALVQQSLAREADAQPGLYDRVIGPVERAVIRHALTRCGGNQSEAAALLGLHRNTLRNKLRQMGLADE